MWSMLNDFQNGVTLQESLSTDWVKTMLIKVAEKDEKCS